jgi:hypothetical protein
MQDEIKHITKWQGGKEVGHKHCQSHQILLFDSFDSESKNLAFEIRRVFTQFDFSMQF